MSESVVLHLGVGSFHRAHQAAYLQQLIEAGHGGWSIIGANVRPDNEAVIAALAAQHCRYVLETVSPAGECSYRRVASIGRVIPWEPTLATVIEIGAAPSTRIVSFTVTEAGYLLGADGRLDWRIADLVADRDRIRAGRAGGREGMAGGDAAIAGGDAAKAGDDAAITGGAAGMTIYGAIAAILRQRQRRVSGPVTLLCCDNVRHNGAAFRQSLLAFLEQCNDPELVEWTRDHTSCPDAMVDRITPRPPADLRDRVRAATGIDDAAPVRAESFIQWVIEDRFVNGRPPWEACGVELVDDVGPYEEAKIRILNASHSGIAWSGTLIGLEFIHEGIARPAIRRLVHDYVTDDVIPCLAGPDPGPVDLHRYRDVVFERFGNAAIRDTNQRVAADGFAKIPGFIAPTVATRLARGQSIDSAAMLPAVFLAFLERWHRNALPWRYQDQAMDPAQARAICEAGDPVAALCAPPGLWRECAGDSRLVDAVRRARNRVDALIAAETRR